jgi:hypothetical protein
MYARAVSSEAAAGAGAELAVSDPSAPRSAAVPLALGVLFLVLYAFFLAYFPRLPGEFSYIPTLHPLPFAAMRGFTFEQFLLHLGRLALLGPGLVFLALAWQRRVVELPSEGRALRTLALGAVGLSLLLSTFVLTRVLGGGAITDDELTYRDQAMRLASGHLADPTLPELGVEPFTVVSRIGTTGKYLFGEPVLQVVGSLLGLPGLLHLPLAALALWAWCAVVRASAGREVALWATAALALSPMFILTNGTGLSHTGSLTCVVLGGLGLTWVRQGRPVAGALLAANALGFGVAVRPQVAIPVGAVLAVVLVRDLARGRHWSALAAFGFSGLAWATLIGVYDAALTGAPWRLPWSLYPVQERLGFDANFGLGGALANLVVTLVRFNGWWLGWPLGLGVIAAWALLGRPAAGLRLWSACALALLALNFFYYSTGVSETGPVYAFELLLPASLLAGHTAVAALRRAPLLASSVLVVHLALGTGSFVFEQTARLARLRDAIHSRVDAMLAQLERPALLITESSFKESLAYGWVWAFPERWRSDRDAVVTFPRHSPEEVRALRERFADRHCYYYRVDPKTLRGELRRCAAAEAFLARPADPDAEGVGLMPAPTAGRLLYYPLLSSIHQDEP